MNWLLLRGLYRQSLNWGDFPSVFARIAPEAKPMLLDLPGCGSASKLESPWSVEEITEEVRTRWLALHERHPGPWSLLAISLGGMVGMRWCEQYPQDFDLLVLVNSSARNLGSLGERFNLGFVPDVVRMIANPDPRFRETSVLKFTSALKGAALDKALKSNTKIAAENPITPGVAIRQLVAGARFDAPRKIDTPTLVIRSLGDQLVNPKCSLRLAHRLGAPLIEHPTAGHDLPLDEPDWLAQILIKKVSN